MSAATPPGLLAELAVVAAGGALGASARYAAVQAAPVAARTFPTTTFVVNVSGAFALGVVLAVLTTRVRAAWWLRPLVATGVLGALTTVSTLAVETAELVRADRPLLGGLYAGATLVTGIAAGAAGLVSGGWRPWRPVPDEGES